MSLAYAYADDRPQWHSPPVMNREARWLAPIRDRFRELLALGPNWDQRGSAAIKSDAALFALNVLFQVLPPNAQPPGIIPLGHGGVQMVWHRDNGELEIEVVEPNHVVVFFIDERGTEREWQASTNFAELGTLLRERFSG